MDEHNVNALAEMLNGGRRREAHDHEMPSHADPSMYDVHIKITDPTLLTLIESVETLKREGRHLARQLRALEAKGKAAVAEAEMLVATQYPDNELMPGAQCSASAIMRGSDGWYVVGTDFHRTEAASKRLSARDNGLGQYL